MKTAKEVLYDAILKHSLEHEVPAEIAESISEGIASNEAYRGALIVYAMGALGHVVKELPENPLPKDQYDIIIDALNKTVEKLS